MRLSEDILDVTRIESKSLEQKKEKFKLNEVIINTMNDIASTREFVDNENIRLTMKMKLLLTYCLFLPYFPSERYIQRK